MMKALPTFSLPNRFRSIIGLKKRTTMVARVSALVFAALFLAVFIAPTAFMQDRSVPVQVAERISEKPSRVAPKEDSKSSDADEMTAESQEPPVFAPELITASTYAFTTVGGASLGDMSSGTTQLVAAGQDDTASAVTNIGFDFWYDGVRFTQFSCNANGLCRLGATAIGTTFTNSLGSTTDAPKIAPFFDDLCTGTNGKVHFKVTGSAPSRILTVEWLNMQITRGAGCAGVGGGTFQMWLFESSDSLAPGAIDFIYGPGMVATAAADGGYSIGLQSGAATNFASVTSTGPAVSYAAANNTQTNAIASGTAYVFAPNIPLAPSGMGVSPITPSTLTLNWGDNATNEVGYVIYRSLDNVTFNFLTQIAAGSTSFTDTGLTPSTQYYYLINAVTEGALSPNLALSATTSPAGNITSVASGNWSAPATWSGGAVPTSGDNVTIAAGHTVTIDSSNALSVTVQSGGILQFEQTTARTLTVGQFVTIDSGGTFRSNLAGTVITHVLSVGTDLTNNGTLDFSTNADTAGAGITFTGAANNTFSGTGATTDVRAIAINKGTSNANILELTTTNFTVRGVATDVAGYLTLTNGTFKISSTFTLANRTFLVAAYVIPTTGGIWLNNPNYTVSAQNGSPTNSGLLRLTLGTYNVGTLAGSNMSGNGSYNIEGGTYNVSGRLQLGSTTIYTQSGGNINVTTVGNTSGTFAGFDGLAGTVMNLSGGNINLVQRNTAATGFDWWVDSTINMSGTGTTVNVGTAATATAFLFRLRGILPNLVVDNTTNAKTASFVAQTLIRGNVLVNSGTTFAINGFLVAPFATTSPITFTNNGTVTGNVAGSRFYWFSSGPALTYTGTGIAGTTGSPLVSVDFDSVGGTSLGGATNNLITNRVILFTGNVTGANKLELGVGGASTGTTQVGNSTTPTAAGTFDVPFTFNLGSGGQVAFYLRTTTSYSTGNEINPTRTLFSMTYDDNDVTHSLTIAGGDLSISSSGAAALALTNGRIITGVNTLSLLSGTATVTRTTGRVDGNFRKTYSAVANKTFEVGTANGYSPVGVDVTAGTFPATFTVKAVQGPQPNIVSPGSALQRYWTLTEGGDVTATLTFNYLDPTDILIPASEATFVIFKYDGSFSQPGGSVNTAANTATIAGVTSFSDWTLAQPNAPTAAPATISGRITRPDGSPLGGASIHLSGNATARSITNGDGQYRFDNVPTDAFYSVTPALANYSFSPASRSFALTGNMTDAGFTANPHATQSSNALDTVDYFVRQQYLDFLGREPDMGGWLFWTSQISACGNNQLCINQKRIDVSAAFFASEEFQQTGSFIYRLYQTGLGRQLSYDEFTTDRSQVLAGPNLDDNRIAFGNEFVTRPEFTLKYQHATTGDRFVDSLLATVMQTTGLDLSAQRDALIAEYSLGADQIHSRSRVLRMLAENAVIKDAAYNPSFVLMEYFGYLRRDVDPGGYAFWLDVLNNGTPGNYRGMVCAFLTSAEYQHRFSTVVTHSNGECGP